MIMSTLHYIMAVTWQSYSLLYAVLVHSNSNWCKLSGFQDDVIIGKVSPVTSSYSTCLVNCAMCKVELTWLC